MNIYNDIEAKQKESNTEDYMCIPIIWNSRKGNIIGTEREAVVA